MATTGNTKTKTTKTEPVRVGINVLIPEALHKRLRVKTINEGLSMSEAIEAAVKAWLR